jgi:hypothetical protein
MAQYENNWQIPGVEEEGDYIEVDLYLAIMAVYRLGNYLGEVGEQVRKKVIDAKARTFRMPKPEQPGVSRMFYFNGHNGGGIYGFKCGDPIELCENLDAVIAFLEMYCEGLGNGGTEGGD